MNLSSYWKMEGTTVLAQVNSQLEKKEELKSLILNKAVVWGSGLSPEEKPYNWCLDTKAVLLDPRGLHLTTLLFDEKIAKHKPEAVGGLTLASHLIASALVSREKSMYNAFLVRRARKSYNMLKLVEGPSLKGKNVVIIDDGLNAAGFATTAIKAVEELGCKVLAVIILINFEKKECKDLKEKGYLVEHIFTLQELGIGTKAKPLNENLYTFLWKYPGINSSDYTAPKSSPVIDSDTIYVGSDRSRLFAIDLKGKLKWEFLADYHSKGIHQTPIIVEEKVIFAGYDGSVYAVEKETGKLLWKNKVSSYIGASPVYDAETSTIFIGLENSTSVGSLAALSISDGAITWELTTQDHVPCRPAIGEKNVVFGCNDKFIYSVEKNTGKLQWKFRTYGANKGRVTIDGNLCFATSFDGHVYCIDEKGKLQWKRKLGTQLYNAPLVTNDLVFIGSYSGQLTALEKKTGKIKWYHMTGDKIQSYPSYDDSMIYFGSHDKILRAVDAKNGKLVWQFQTEGPISSSPTVEEDILCVSGNDGYLYCFKKN